jgi:hypothetical protein
MEEVSWFLLVYELLAVGETKEKRILCFPFFYFLVESLEFFLCYSREKQREREERRRGSFGGLLLSFSCCKSRQRRKKRSCCDLKEKEEESFSGFSFGSAMKRNRGRREFERIVSYFL